MAHKILIVDDERSVANFLNELFEIRGYEPAVFYESKRAIEAFEKDPHSFDLVLTDQTMPNITGAELAAKLLSIRPDIPIILCTGFSEAINEDIALEMGISCYMTKPIDIEELLDKVEELLAKGYVA